MEKFLRLTLMILGILYLILAINEIVEIHAIRHTVP